MSALGRLLPALGPRWALVTDADGAPDSAESPAVTVAVADRAGGSVRGALGNWPVQSESVTGALVRLRDGAGAEASFAEAFRVLQPGGLVVFSAAWRAGDVPAFLAALSATDLRVTRRIAERRADAAPTLAESVLPGWASWRASHAGADVRIECVFAAARPGGFETDFPTSREILASMFVPRRWRAAAHDAR